MKNNTRPVQFSIAPAARIVVVKPKKLSEGAITVASEKTEPPEIGEIVEIGSHGYNERGKLRKWPLSMKKGDTIAYRKFGESSFYIGGEMFKFVSFDDVLAVIKEKK